MHSVTLRRGGEDGGCGNSSCDELAEGQFEGCAATGHAVHAATGTLLPGLIALVLLRTRRRRHEPRSRRRG